MEKHFYMLAVVLLCLRFGIHSVVTGLLLTQIPSYSDCSLIRLDRLEYHIREELNKTAQRTMVVLNPLKVNIDLLLFLDSKHILLGVGIF